MLPLLISVRVCVICNIFVVACNVCGNIEINVWALSESFDLWLQIIIVLLRVCWAERERESELTFRLNIHVCNLIRVCPVRNNTLNFVWYVVPFISVLMGSHRFQLALCSSYGLSPALGISQALSLVPHGSLRFAVIFFDNRWFSWAFTGFWDFQELSLAIRDSHVQVD